MDKATQGQPIPFIVMDKRRFQSLPNKSNSFPLVRQVQGLGSAWSLQESNVVVCFDDLFQMGGGVALGLYFFRRVETEIPFLCRGFDATL